MQLPNHTRLRSGSNASCSQAARSIRCTFKPCSARYSKLGLAAAEVVGSVTDSEDNEPTTSGTEAMQRRLGAAGVAPVARSDMFTDNHVIKWTPRLMAYLPLGLALALGRSLLWIACIAADAPWFRERDIIDTYLSLLGVRVVWSGEENIPKDESHVIVSNHVSVGDLMMLFTRPLRYTHLITSSLPGPVYGTKHLPVVLRPASKDSYEQLSTTLHTTPESLSSFSEVESDTEGDPLSQPAPSLPPAWAQHEPHTLGAAPLQPHSSSSSSSRSRSSVLTPLAFTPGQPLPQHQQQQQQNHHALEQQQQQGSEEVAAIHLFPEGGMTNGRAMMHFSRGFMRFASPLPVIPVALTLVTPFPEVSSHTLTSGFLGNLFWFSFQPWCEIHATALPPMRYTPGTSKAQFVHNVQLAIAERLGVWVSDLNIQQKKKMIRRKQGK